MKIVIIAPTDRSTAIKFLPNVRIEDLPIGYSGAPFIGTIIEEYLKRNHEVIALTTSEDLDFQKGCFKISHKGFTWIVVSSRKRSFMLNGRKLGRMMDFNYHERKEMVNQIKILKPDIIHAHWSYEFAHAALSSGYACLITVHDNAIVVFRYFKNLYRFFRLIHSELVLRRTKFASTVSPYMMNYVLNRVKKCEVIPNPVHIRYTLDNVKKFLNKRWESIDKPKIAIISNGWEGRKNGICGMLAFESLLKVLPHAELHLFGSGTEINGPAYIDSNHYKIKNIFFHGMVDHECLMNELEGCHLLIHPAIEESFGVVIIEAMSLGIPVIGGSESGAVPWVINKRELLTNILDPDKIFQVAFNLVKNEDNYRSVSLDCYKNVKDRFSIENVADQYLNYYDKIIENNTTKE